MLHGENNEGMALSITLKLGVLPPQTSSNSTELHLFMIERYAHISMFFGFKIDISAQYLPINRQAATPLHRLSLCICY
ncbi:hypothetical protein BZL35_00631 [Candidatus Pandoraea novymonadis]|uniref:Uncharacterized protein n=1 Tax=Candidatus Pandoraea novymonadis TaxID=1808959 RepID=A0ABX5FFA8_9BURK|nr:hypothetical protein BZL35_00631 [Candidatus Pandoraea novymonadis]